MHKSVASETRFHYQRSDLMDGAKGAMAMAHVLASEERSGGLALKARLAALKAAEPMVRARDAAEKLGVSEAELVACRAGEGVVRLAGDWGKLVRALPKLGRVMALTRNQHCVHEKTGKFGKISVQPSHGIVLNRDIDLRLFFTHWHHGFAVTEDVRSGRRRSLQFFDSDGAAVHKVYLVEDSDGDAYDALVDKWRAADQSPELEVLPPPSKRPDPADETVDVQSLRAHWLALQDTHDFIHLLNDFGVGRRQALRLVGSDLAYRVRPDALRTMMEAARAAALPIMVFVASPGCVQIHSGPVERLAVRGPWFNVLDPGFNLHLREDRIDQAWVVRKPTRDGIVTSLELYDAGGFHFAQFFGKRSDGREERADWRAIAEGLERL